jgi:hypothetical protein
MGGTTVLKVRFGPLCAAAQDSKRVQAKSLGTSAQWRLTSTEEKASLLMATGAVARSRLIENDALAVDIPMAGVAKLTLYLFVRAFEGKGALSLVVEDGGLPVLCIMAKLAVLRLAGFDELARMRVLVAGRAICRSGAERRLGHLAFGAGRFVAIVAGNLRVSAGERERRLGVIEFRQVRPCFHGVACFAAFWLAIRAALSHVLLELVAVRIRVAAGA